MRCSSVGALGHVELHRLLGEQRVDLGIVAIDIGAALDHERLQTGRGVAERAGRALDEVLQLLLAVAAEEGGALQRTQLHANAGFLEVVEHRLAEIGVGGVAVIVAGIEALGNPASASSFLAFARSYSAAGGFQ